MANKHYKTHPLYISQGLNDRQKTPMLEPYEKICMSCGKPFNPARTWYRRCAVCNILDVNFAPIQWEYAA